MLFRTKESIIHSAQNRSEEGKRKGGDKKRGGSSASSALKEREASRCEIAPFWKEEGVPVLLYARGKKREKRKRNPITSWPC